jgi:Clp amino terminal domain, pathogenicity island component
MAKIPVRLDDLIQFVKAEHPGATPLELLSAAVLVSEHVGEVADHLIGHFVDQARRAGSSWTGIGQSMGVTKQAAQKRFIPGDLDDASLARFTDRAKVVLLKASNEGRNRGHDQVGSEHLVLGLLAEWEGLAGKAIEAQGVTQEAVLAAANAAMPANGEPRLYHIPFTAGMKKVRELTVREALRLGHNYIGTEHMLLGLLEAGEEPGAQILTGLGVTKAASEEWILQKLEWLKRSRSQ